MRRPIMNQPITLQPTLRPITLRPFMTPQTQRTQRMMSKQTAAMTLLLALGALTSPNAASSQISAPSPAVLATANNYTALARGFTAIALNPAGLAMPGNPGFTLTFLPVQARAGMSAMSLSDIATYDDMLIPDAVREEWLQTAIDDGGFDLRGGGSVTGLALSIGPVGLQVSTVGAARGSLSPDAFELLLFGNAGRTGTIRDMSLEGTGASTWAATTAALAVGIPLPVVQEGRFALGATVKYTVGHVAGLATDVGSVIRANPFGVDLSLPSIIPADVDLTDNGSGVGLDLGLAWEGTTWAFSAAVQNVVNSFEWKLDNYEYRLGELTLDGTSVTTNFDAGPAVSTPSAIRDELLAQRFELAFNTGIAFRPSEMLALMADFRHETGEALVIGERSSVGLGAELRVIPFLPLRGGFSRVTDGAYQIGAGFGLELGPVVISAAYLTEKGSAGEFRAASVALSFGQ